MRAGLCARAESVPNLGRVAAFGARGAQHQQRRVALVPSLGQQRTGRARSLALGVGSATAVSRCSSWRLLTESRVAA